VSSATPRSLVRKVSGTAFVMAACSHAQSAAGAERERERAPEVGLTVEDCAEPFESALRRILRIELGELLDEGGPSANSDRDWLEIRCRGQAADVRARSRRGDQVVDNNQRLDAFPGDAAPRAAALAAIEALGAIGPSLSERIEARHTRGKPLERRAETQRAKAPGVDRERREWTQVGIAATTRLFLSKPGLLAWGGRVEVVRRLSLPLALGIDIEGAWARRGVDLGELSARLLSSGLWTGVSRGDSVFSGSLGVGGRLGLTELAGAPGNSEVRGHRVVRGWVGPMLVGRIDAGTGALVAAAALESGFAAAGAEGLSGASSALVVRGGWLALSLAFGIRL
jgi:hypothetical protein